MCSEHAANVLLVCKFAQSPLLHAVPPGEEHRCADELEPWREFQCWVFKVPLELLLGHILVIPYFVGVDLKIDISLDEQNVVD